MKNNTISYIEFGTTDITKSKNFYSQAFGWDFVDYGPEYSSFSNSGLKGGFELQKDIIVGGPLVVLYHADLEEIQAKITELGGIINMEIFDFPGGKRFEFSDPTGNKLAVWSE